MTRNLKIAIVAGLVGVFLLLGGWRPLFWLLMKLVTEICAQ